MNQKLTCEDCGNDRAIKTFCPYSKDIYFKIVEITVCDKCYEERTENLERIKEEA